MQVSKGLGAQAQRVTAGRLFVLDLSGGRIVVQGNLAGIAYADVPVAGR